MLNQIITANLNFVSNAGDKYFMILVYGVLSAAYLFTLNKKKEGLLVLVGLASTSFAWLLKFIYKQPRPETSSNHFVLDIYSFPSSHTLTYTAFFGLMIYLAFKLISIPLPLRIITVLVSVYFIALVGISRVYLGQHYTWDVIGGYIFGALYLTGLILIDKHT